MNAPASSTFRWIISLTGIFVLFALVAYYSSRIADLTTTYDQERAQERYAKLKKLQEADVKTLTTVDWVDQDKGVVRIPIDEAMAEEVAALKAKPVQAASALPNAAPSPAPAAPPATNAAPATAGATTTNAPAAAATPPTQ